MALAGRQQIGQAFTEPFDAPFMLSPMLEHPELMPVYDSINRRFGRGTLFVAAQGTPESRSRWAMRRAYLTPQYTTDWRSLPRITC